MMMMKTMKSSWMNWAWRVHQGPTRRSRAYRTGEVPLGLSYSDATVAAVLLVSRPAGLNGRETGFCCRVWGLVAAVGTASCGEAG